MGNHRKRDDIYLHARSAVGRPRDAVVKPATDGKSDERSGVPVGGLVRFEGEDYYRIASYDRMPPFLMTLATDTDLWMFVTSGGGLTAGRVDADGSIFPYETVDRLHDGHCSARSTSPARSALRST